MTPDVFIRRTGQGYAVELNSATLPRLLVNRRYYQELKTRAAGQGVEGLAERVPDQRQLAGQSARPAGADDRQGGVARSSSASRASSNAASAALKPLTLREVGEAIEMHESTVSRVTSNKYVLCDRGLFELKYFFSSGVGSSDEGGEGAAAGAVKAAIGELIAQETEILSDDTLVELLKERGFDLARRTVAKYREAMGIGSSIQRRRRTEDSAAGS